MQTSELKEYLKGLNKLYFTTSDLAKIIIQPKQSLRVTISRLLKKDILRQIKRGFYFLPDQSSKIDQIIGQIYYPCYLSFETALTRYGLLNQIPYTLSFASFDKSQRFFVGELKVELVKIKRELFFGFSQTNNLFIALPEKALLDQLYLVSLGKAKIDYDELNLKGLSKTKFLKFSKKFPQTTQKIANNLVPNFGKVSVTV